MKNNPWWSYIWELPQKFVAWIIILFHIFGARKAPITSEAGVNYYYWNYTTGGMSLSNYIFLPAAHYENHNLTDAHVRTMMHEYGHTIQSRMLGPLYLIVIALPSLTWAGCFEGYRQKKGKSYYSFYTEAWADKLGGVKREE